MRDCGESGINRRRSVLPERNAEFVAFTNDVLCLVKNKVGGIDSEILSSDEMSRRFSLMKIHQLR
jgi:hypothetical protein